MMSSSTTPQLAQDENALVERVFLRIGSAETDDQLQAALGKFLTPLLLKLNSQDDVVRTKVLKLLAHIKTRLNSRKQILLPLDALLTQFQDPQATPFITNFTILFIKMGFQREESKKQAELVPLLLHCLEGRSTNHQDSLLQLFTHSLHHVSLPKTEAECQSRFPLKDNSMVKSILLDYLMDVLLLPYNSHAAVNESIQSPPPPGLSQSGFKRQTAENAMLPEELERTKLSVINFLGCGVVDEAEVAVHFVVASSDTRHSVATSADMELKKIIGSVDWNSKEILHKLFSIFQGTVVLKGKPAPKPEDIKSPVNTRIRLKIFPLFLRAREAGNTFPSCLQIVFDCLFGANPNAKLRVMAVEFVHHIVLHCEDGTFSAFDVVLLNGMLKLIKEAKEDAKLRGLAYVAVGKIGCRSPSRLTKDIQVVQTFFDALCQEEGDTRLAVQEALSMMSSVFSSLDDTNKALMEALLLQNVDKQEGQARAVAVQYASQVFPTDHMPSRYILLIGAGDIKDDIRAESVRVLRNSEVKEGRTKKEVKLPDFADMVNYITVKANQRKQSKNRYVAINTTMAFNPHTYSEMILYMRACLSQLSNLSPTWVPDELMSQSPELAPKVREMVASGLAEGPLGRYLTMTREIVAISATGETMFCLLEMVAMTPDLLAPQLVDQLDWIKSLLGSSKDDIKRSAAELYGIVCCYGLSQAQWKDTVEECLKMIGDKNPEIELGALLSLGYLNSIRARMLSETKSSQDSNTKEILLRCIKELVKPLSENNAERKGLVCLALGEIGRSCPLPLPDGAREKNTEEIEKSEKETKTDSKDKEDKILSKLSIVNTLVAMVKTSNEAIKTKERAVMCLGDICVGDAEFPHRQFAMESLFNAVTNKQVDLQFTIGQALVNIALGVTSPRARCIWTTSPQAHKKDTKDMTDCVPWFLSQLLDTYVPHPNPHLRQAASVWLLTLVKESGSHKAVQDQLINVQNGFMRMLGESDDITQDIASKGLGMVMEVCTPEQKDKLVQELVEALMTGKRAKNEVSGSTKVFQAGTLGKSPDGAGLSTYSELCAIATDLNQPDLIYKFMHLANHNASWNARKGAAFGFSTIAAQAGEQLAPYLPQIVPRLYRYRFDPNPRIQQAMSGIWNVLVQDNKKTVDTYLKEILSDLMKNLTSSQWRVRESSCLAVSDLLRGRVLDDIIDDLPTLWETCLRVRDDIKESVRLAADQACKILSKVSIKICDIGQGASGERAIRTILPCLLKSSLQTSVSEVRAIGLSTILEISRNAGSLLKPNIPLLVPALLEAVSGLENQVVNYLSLHMGTQERQDKLDSARVAASKSSPMMETVSRCVQFVDEEVLTELVPRLVELIRGGIGVATKAGVAGFIVSLVHQCPRDLSQYAGKLMSALLHGFSDRNVVVRKSYASALGHLVKVAKDSSVEKLIQKLKSWYLDNEDPMSRQACCVTIHAISKHSPDSLRRHATEVMPLTFFAMHEIDEGEGGERKEKSEDVISWEDVWNEITPGTEAGIRLHITEITALLSTCLSSQAWSVKAQSARAMATVASRLGKQLTHPNLGQVLQALDTGLQGRTWKGKEALLTALSEVCIACRQEVLKGNPSSTITIDQVVASLLRESGKTLAEYKVSAMKSLGPVLETYEVDRFSQVWDLTQPILNINSNSNADKDEDRSINTEQDLVHSSFTLLGEAWPLVRQTQDDFCSKFSTLLRDSMSVSTWKVQIVILKDFKKLLERSEIFQKEKILNDSEQIRELCNRGLDMSLINIGNTRYASLRSESLSLSDLLLHRLAECDRLSLLSLKSRQQLVEELSALAESGPWELRDQAKTALKLTSMTSDSGQQAMDTD